MCTFGIYVNLIYMCTFGIYAHLVYMCTFGMYVHLVYMYIVSECKYLYLISVYLLEF